MSDFVFLQSETTQTFNETKINNKPNSAIKRHPYLTLFVACFAVNGILNPASGAFFIGLFATIGIVFFSSDNTKDRVALSVVLSIIYFLTIAFSKNVETPVLLGFILLIGILIYGVYLYFNKKLTYEMIALLLVVAGFILRVVYVMYTDVGVYGISQQERQHDVFYFGTGEMVNFRHAEYIEWFYNNLSFPDVEPSGLSQFYHPPLHHLIAGLWLRFNTTIGLDYSNACESIQILTLFYSSSVMITIYKILRVLKLKGFAVPLCMAFICFHPNFIIMSGSVNNDILSISLGFGAFLAALRWYYDPKISKITITALCVGGSMATKLSGALIAPAIAILFLVRFWQSLKKGSAVYKNLMAQFVLFGAICAPIGLFWQVRSYLKYGLPITYVPSLSPSSNQYLGEYTVFQRIFGIESESFNRVFVAWKNAYGSSFNEYNMLIALIKTSIFGEFALFYNGDNNNSIIQIGNIFATILFWSAILMVIILFVATVWGISKKHRGFDNTVNNSFLTIVVVVIFSYIKFCFEYPQVCTQNFRYAVLLLIPATVFLCNFINSASQSMKKSETRIINLCLASVIGGFCVSSILVYLLLGLM